MPLFLLWLLSWNEAAVGADTVTVLRALSLFDHFQSFSVGVIEVRDVFYFVALIAGFWWATLRVLEARQWRGRRWTASKQWLRIAAAIPALLAIFVFGQLVLDARGWRADLTPERRYTLSARAHEVLHDLDVDVRALAFLRSMDPRNVPIRDLLAQVSAVSPRLHVETLDLNRSPALAREYDVHGVALVLEAAGRRRLVSNPTEESLLAGLLAVTRPTPRRLAWVVGHGEGDIESTERQTGYARIRRLLTEEQYLVRPTTLGIDGIPEDTDAVVIAGPKQDFLAEELAVLNGYLQRPGRAVIMLDPLKAPELSRALSRYQVELDDEIVVDPSGRLYGGEWLTMRLVTVSGLIRSWHPSPPIHCSPGFAPYARRRRRRRPRWSPSRSSSPAARAGARPTRVRCARGAPPSSRHAINVDRCRWAWRSRFPACASPGWPSGAAGSWCSATRTSQTTSSSTISATRT
jgi:hypothetical protein